METNAGVGGAEEARVVPSLEPQRAHVHAAQAQLSEPRLKVRAQGPLARDTHDEVGVRSRLVNGELVQRRQCTHEELKVLIFGPRGGRDEEGGAVGAEARGATGGGPLREKRTVVTQGRRGGRCACSGGGARFCCTALV